MSARKRETGFYSTQPFRRAVFRGLGLVLPPLLTIVILLWIGNSVQKFVLNPVEWSSRRAMVWYMNETKTTEEVLGAGKEPGEADQTEPKEDAAAQDPPTDDAADSELQQVLEAVKRLEQRLQADSDYAFGASLTTKRADELRHELFEEDVYVQLENGEWIPDHIRNAVNKHVRETGIPLVNASGKGYYNHYVEHLILRKAFVIPFFLAGFILLMYLLGKFLAAGVGRILWNSMEAVITQVPIIRTVYSSVKQVTDFFVGESDIEFKRVVAVEYPRKGLWSVGFVTGESLRTIRGAADQEPIVSVLMPTSPVPGTGFTITVRKSETVDVDIPIEQALQFVVSCGVVIPDEELQDHVQTQIQEAAQRRLTSDDALAIEQQ